MSDDAPDLLDPNGEELSELLTQWDEAKREAASWTAKEVALRKQIFDGLFPAPVPGQGNKVRLPFKMALIGDYRLNYRVDEAGMMATRPLIDPAVFDSVIGFRPSVRDAKFRELDSEVQRPFTGFITVTAGTPGLELKPADKVRWK